MKRILINPTGQLSILIILTRFFLGTPKCVLVERIVASDDYEAALARLKYKHWNWLTVPGIEKRIGDAATIQQWIIAQRAAKKNI